MTEQTVEQASLFAPDTWSGRMSQEHSVATKAKTSPQSSKKRSGSLNRKPPMCLYLRKDGQQADAYWETDGALLGEYSMHSFGESPNAAVVSHLSQILEDNPHPKYYLSAKACMGILNRAERRGKDLPPELKQALAMQSELGGGCDGGGKGALVQEEVSGTLGCNNDQTIFTIDHVVTTGGNCTAQGSCIYENIAPTLKSAGTHAVMDKPQTAYAIGSYHSNAWKSDNPNSGVYETDVAKTLDAVNCGYPGCNQGGTAILDMTHANDVIRECGETVPTLQSRMGTGGNQVPLLFGYPDADRAGTLDASYFKGAGMRNGMERQIVYTAGKYGEYKQGCGTLRAAGGDYGGGSENIVAAVDCRNGTECDTNGALQSCASHNVNSNNTVRQYRTVRRLTPLECERLQGFPDHWTDIGAWVDSKGKKHETSDAARYKALGNSIALPPWKWVLKRLCAQYERDATMASLFDGIGGFPLIWEQLNGEGSCVWASEIEEFPMAVTKLRFSPTGQKG